MKFLKLTSRCQFQTSREQNILNAGSIEQLVHGMFMLDFPKKIIITILYTAVQKKESQHRIQAVWKGNDHQEHQSEKIVKRMWWAAD